MRLSKIQYRALSFLVDQSPFSQTKLWVWGIQTTTWNALVRHGWVKRQDQCKVCHGAGGWWLGKDDWQRCSTCLGPRREPHELLIWKVTDEGKNQIAKYRIAHHLNR